jgi:putative membrane protein insertion efficiency factor
VTLTDPRPAAATGTPGIAPDQEREVEGVDEEARAGGRVAGWLLAWVHTYQMLRSGRPTGCRFVPTCSEYATDAIERRGAAAGSALAVRRLLRCGPWGGHGFDPVPDGRDRCTHP